MANGKEIADYIRQKERERKALAKKLEMTEEEKIMKEIDEEERQINYIELLHR